MKKVIITGVTGFIGSALAKELLSEGVTVYGVGRNGDKLKVFEAYKNFIPILIDFSDYALLSEMIKDNDIDVFYHLAWQGYGKYTNDFYVQYENIKATYEACSQAVKIQCGKFVFAGSSHEYQKNVTNSLGNCSIYGGAKKASSIFAKTVCHNAGIEFNSVCFVNVFGIGDTSKRSANSIINLMQNGISPKLVKGECLYDWTYIDDAVGGIIAVGDKGLTGKNYYIGSRMLRPFSEIINDVRDVIDSSIKLKFGEYEDDTFIDYNEIDIYELYRDTGYLASCDFKESILKTAEWLRDNDIFAK